jgi:hypothetical protein
VVQALLQVVSKQVLAWEMPLVGVLEAQALLSPQVAPQDSTEPSQGREGSQLVRSLSSALLIGWPVPGHGQTPGRSRSAALDL